MSSRRHAQSLATRMPGGTAAASMPGSSAVLESWGTGMVASRCVPVESASLSVTPAPYAAWAALRGSPAVRGHVPTGPRVHLVTIGHHTAYARGMSSTGNGRPTLAVTGATGCLGGRDLADRGVAQRLPVRDVARAPELPGSLAARCSYRDADAARAALEGVATLFMVSAAENA